MTANPSKTNDYYIGCSDFLLRLKAKELNVPNNSKNNFNSANLHQKRITLTKKKMERFQGTPLSPALQVPYRKKCPCAHKCVKLKKLDIFSK